MILKNIKYGKFLELDYDNAYPYVFAFKHGRLLTEPVDHIGFKPLVEYTFKQVKDSMYYLSKGVNFGDIPEFIALFTNEKPKRYLNMGVIEVLQSFSYLKKEIEQQVNAEQQTLNRQLTPKDYLAGIEKFGELGNYPEFEILAIRFNQTIEWVEQQPYSKMFLSNYYNKLLADFQEAYSKIP